MQPNAKVGTLLIVLGFYIIQTILILIRRCPLKADPNTPMLYMFVFLNHQHQPMTTEFLTTSQSHALVLSTRTPLGYVSMYHIIRSNMLIKHEVCWHHIYDSLLFVHPDIETKCN